MRPLRALFGWAAALLGALSLCAGSAHAEDRVYWLNQASGTIGFSPLDGGPGGTFSVATMLPFSSSGLAFDRGNQRFYWTDRMTGRVSFTSFSGSESETLETDMATVSGPTGLALDPSGEEAYWANERTGSISFSALDGSLGGDLKVSAPAVLGHPDAIAVDTGAGRIYWTNGSGPTPISFANLDGSGGGTVNSAGATVNEPLGLAVYGPLGRVYWTNANGNRISWANLDGSGGQDLPTGEATVNSPVGVAIDPAAGRIYWANRSVGKISWANLDGSGGQDLTVASATPAAPEFPLLVMSPRPAGQAAIGGGSHVGATLTCGASWVPDHPEYSFYDAPDGVSYQWSRDGVDIPGATRPTLSATAVPGAYSCRVTATNHAGQAVEVSGLQKLAPVAFGKGTLVTLRLTSHLVSKVGAVGIRIENANPFPVTGQLEGLPVKGRGKVRSKRFEVAAQSKLVLRTALPGALQGALAQRGKLRLAFQVNVTDLTGDERTIEKILTVKEPR